MKLPLFIIAIFGLQLLFSMLCGGSFCFGDTYYYWGETSSIPGVIIHFMGQFIGNVWAVRLFGALISATIAYLIIDVVKTNTGKEGAAYLAAFLFFISIAGLEFSMQLLKNGVGIILILAFIRLKDTEAPLAYFLAPAFAMASYFTHTSTFIFLGLGTLIWSFWPYKRANLALTGCLFFLISFKLLWFTISFTNIITPSTWIQLGLMAITLPFAIISLERMNNGFSNLLYSFILAGLLLSFIGFAYDFSYVWRFMLDLWPFLLIALTLFDEKSELLLLLCSLAILANFASGLWQIWQLEELYPLEDIPLLANIISRESPQVVMLPAYDWQYGQLLRAAGFGGNITYSQPCDLYIEKRVYFYEKEGPDLIWKRCKNAQP